MECHSCQQKFWPTVMIRWIKSKSKFSACLWQRWQHVPIRMPAQAVFLQDPKGGVRGRIRSLQRCTVLNLRSGKDNSSSRHLVRRNVIGDRLRTSGWRLHWRSRLLHRLLNLSSRQPLLLLARISSNDRKYFLRRWWRLLLGKYFVL